MQNVKTLATVHTHTHTHNTIKKSNKNINKSTVIYVYF